MESGESMFKVNDFVWAKLGRYPPWPAIVMEPNPLVQPKHKNSHWIYFFGSHDYAWIEEKHIKPFEEYKDQFKATYKQASMREAVKEIEEIIENLEKDPDYEIEFIKYTRKERRQSSGSRKSSESSMERKRPIKESSRSRSRKKSGSSASADTDSDSGETSPFNEINNPMSISLKTFGFLAANIYDEGIIKNLIKSGHRVQVWSSSIAMCEELQDYADRQEAYFRICRTRRELVRNCDIVFNHQTDPEQVTAVLKELGVSDDDDDDDDDDNILDGKGYVEMTNITPEISVTHCKKVENKGGAYIEAMLQGSLSEANKGVLLVLAAGEQPLFRECQSCFKAMGKVTLVWEHVGTATRIHMLLEAMRGVLVASFTEFFALADKWGIKLDDFLHVFSLTSMASPFFKSKADIIISKKFEETEEPLQVIQRNLLEVCNSSNRLRQPTPLVSSTNEIFKHARRLGYDNQDSASIYNRTRY